ncbi:ABC transporter ATP-binding protein [uncultured Anaerococcus sp.]|mgnify:CR=1 FL=1|uniref:ABC transporter ATP-binding protein n=1 Tax=uncultured Anaerococcus sp. TaxID=293428 RepID=UPI0025D4A319|nr:ABC transporter ATP-binding protein [uncultured Anaerococcus sp.]
MENIINLTHIRKIIKDGSNNLEILKNLSLTVNRGDMVSIIGSSGSGKTTLLNIIAMLDSKYEGSYIFDGEELSSKSEKELFNLRCKNIGYIFQDFKLIEEFDVVKNVEIPLGFLGYKRNDRLRLSKEAVKKVGLETKYKTKVYKLSGGERQRVAIARALSFNPKIILADEPTGSLDKNTSLKIIDLLQELNKKYNVTILLVSHDLNIAKKATRILKLEGGHLNEEK